MERREEIKIQILEKKLKINHLEKEINELTRETLLLSDDKSQFVEQKEFITKRINRKKVMEEKLIGRVHWVQDFEDEDTGEKIKIQRSCVVRENGEWINGY